MDGALEQLAHEASLRALDKQERLLEDLRARTGIQLAASSIAASFLGDAAFSGSGSVALSAAALAAFIVSTAASVYVLLPKHDLSFSVSGAVLYEELFELRTDMVEAYRLLAYALDWCWASNNRKVKTLARAYWTAAVALLTEVLALVALVGDRIV